MSQIGIMVCLDEQSLNSDLYETLLILDIVSNYLDIGLGVQVYVSAVVNFL